ncbi:uncharacterized protein LOC120276350 [Dioscorea cayenensis subsp. rotundata]|uniref:Uncharacterized protein LOC120276350 n=1 Tax=Dioscorea cayennensis subsp. rotundata TaxID=55577 RepID=A0AB40CGE3_DIOCR|nr:uncharacterized protein LOC120276350 [Dioscorea cayenensis subsp. rotundata]XP_039139009.1 uncharacterized protein LOC120276350 [Dioscorea cayenensis subsp. rotundata]XP_039139010.1 uncharacterized protein LOC120276350 [Dioscorea cayenensis subsp. rotundata]XP_039139011.1 uncharacterized protein LOC120276350 [Dioscorea cayenensis subsp. rotundata]XP_039139012.1 uncharacterized protein LOC120276350 [Dioscorea cayenensis subsp. rotundata]
MPRGRRRPRRRPASPPQEPMDLEQEVLDQSNAEEQPDLATLTGIMRELMLMMRNQNHQHASRGSRDLLTEFGQHAPSFEGTTDLIVVEYWVKQIERTFRAMQSPDEDKVRLASYMLRNSAALWFERELRLKGEDAFKTWEQFKEAFYAKYFPLSRRAQMERQFLNLKQGSMTVEEYEAEFDRLSQFAPSLVEDENNKSYRFVEGLKNHIRRALVPFLRLPYVDVVGIAKDLEITWQETQDSGRREQQWNRGLNPWKSQSSGSSFGHSKGKHRSRPYSRPSASSSGSGSRGSAGSVTQEIRSPTCGGHHSQAECRRAARTCFRCGSQKHFVAQCPQSPPWT